MQLRLRQESSSFFIGRCSKGILILPAARVPLRPPRALPRRAGARCGGRRPPADCRLPGASSTRALSRPSTARAPPTAEKAHRSEVERQLKTLTPRETQVLALVVAGFPNKQIAGKLGASEKTIKVHRARVMEKMRAGSLAALVQMAYEARLISPQEH